MKRQKVSEDAIIILRNAEKKIKKYNREYNKRYNEAYKKILDARKGKSCLVNRFGNVSDTNLQLIEDTLRIFRMGRQMDKMFFKKLKKKLNNKKVKTILKNLRGLKIKSLEWQREKYKSKIKFLYDILASRGKDSLSADRDRFTVGATKIMNFLFPELFVMVDSNVTNALKKEYSIKRCRIKENYYSYYCFENYWDIMLIAHRELNEWKKRYGNVASLLKKNGMPTTLPRIFDKCAFVMGKEMAR